jgi:MarR family transcriptional regulator, organic hydroperoxide resistance regulator
MQASGLLTRRRDEHDARLVRLYLTDRGRSARAAIETERDNLAQRATATLTDTERRALVRALAKIVEEFSDDPIEATDDAL